MRLARERASSSTASARCNNLWLPPRFAPRGANQNIAAHRIVQAFRIEGAFITSIVCVPFDWYFRTWLRAHPAPERRGDQGVSAFFAAVNLFSPAIIAVYHQCTLFRWCCSAASTTTTTTALISHEVRRVFAAHSLRANTWWLGVVRSARVPARQLMLDSGRTRARARSAYRRSFVCKCAVCGAFWYAASLARAGKTFKKKHYGEGKCDMETICDLDRYNLSGRWDVRLFYWMRNRFVWDLSQFACWLKYMYTKRCDQSRLNRC